MKVNHTHDYQPSFYDVSSVYRKLICTSCGCTTISPLYTVDTEANSILYSNYYMFGNVELPSSIQGVEIKHIQDFAFQDNDKLTSINIPEGVVSIGDFVFNNCINLYEIILPSTLEYIGANAFFGCQNLRSISWPSKVNTIKEGVFKNCAKFVNIFANLQF